MRLAINASRAKSGGGILHLIEILSNSEPLDYGFSEVHVWAHEKLLSALPNKPWLIRHLPKSAKASILKQLWWEFFDLPRELSSRGCEILLNVDAGTVCPFRPAVTMSRDMLAFEPGEASRLGFGRARFRQFFLKYIQCRSLSKSDGAIFLTNYAAKVIGSQCRHIKSVKIIPHGVSTIFEKNPNRWKFHGEHDNSLQILYVSPVWVFKHQWHVVRAVEILRAKGLNVFLKLVGGGDKLGLEILNHQISQSDPNSFFVDYVGEVPHKDLPLYLSEADIFVFASSCENMPNSLIEAMKSALPIACSNRGPMREILQDGGVYFDPEEPESIANAIENLIVDAGIRERASRRAFELSKPYSWVRCAHDTFDYISQVFSRA